MVQRPSPRTIPHSKQFKMLRSLTTHYSHMLLIRNSKKVVLTDDWKVYFILLY